MTNPSPEITLDEPDSNSRSTQQLSVSNPTTKKKSGFQITSVTDSGHGRPSSIVRDGEESADDLDESHASYSDVSYSRATDADHDQESTASEDTLNISAHESSSVPHADSVSSINHTSAIHSHQSHQAMVTSHTTHDATVAAANKTTVQKEGVHDSKKVQITTSNVPTSNNSKDALNKQHSEHLESPQELPHDNGTSDPIKYRKTDEGDSITRNQPGSGGKSNNSHESQQNPEQNLNSSTTTVSSFSSSSTTTLPSVTSHSVDVAVTSSADRPNLLNSALVTSGTTTTKPVAVSSSMPGIKAPGTRVYKVVKRETGHPTKRIRGRWNWYDFSDNQAPMTAVSSQAMSTARLTNDGASLHTYTYTNTLMSPSVVPFGLQQSESASSLLLKDQLLSAAGLKSDHRDVQMMSLGTDALRSAIKYVGGRTTGDPSTGDMSAATRTVKIDNKIEVAMDLVKRHLMSAVRDEVDELKEKIKDLTQETARLRTENKELRAVIPPDILSHAQSNLPKDFAKENQSSGETVQNPNTVDGTGILQSSSTTSLEHSSQKGVNANIPQDPGASSALLAARLHGAKTKIPNPSMTQTSTMQNQRPDVLKVATTKSAQGIAQPAALTQPHMSGGGAHSVSKGSHQTSIVQQHAQTASQQLHDQQKSEPGLTSPTENVSLKQTSAKMQDANFDKKNPS